MHTPVWRTAVAAIILCLIALPAPGRAQPQPPAPPAPQQAPQRRVTAIDVRGNKRVPTERIQAVITATKVGEPLSDEKVRDDIKAIIDLGLFADVSVRLEPNDDGVRVVFFVTENPTVSEVIVEGNTVVSSDDIRRALGVPSGEVLNLNRMREGARAVQKLYEERGYVLARVQDVGLVPVDEAGEQGRLRVRIVEGTVEAVRFQGLQKTQERTIRRHLTIKRGDIFNVNQLNRDLQRLFDLGLFESLRARPEPGSSPDSAVIIIEVKEARTAQVTGGIGYSTRDGLVGFVEFRDRNWRGLGQSFSVRTDRGVQLSSGRFNYEVNFTEPFLDQHRTALDIGLFSRTSVEKEYSGTTAIARFELQRTGSFVSFSRPLDPFTTATVRLKSELTAITPLPLVENDPSSPVVTPSSSFMTPGRVLSILLSAARDTRNDRFSPTRGERIFLSSEFGLRALGGDFGFGKYTAEYQRYFPTGPKSAFVGRVLAGMATGNLPAQEQFLLGGPSTVRSYPASRFRGNSMFVVNLEYRFPLGTFIRQLGEVQGIVFVDAGNIPLQFSSVKLGYGVGVALATPLGPIRIDVAFGPEGTQTWLSLGSPF